MSELVLTQRALEDIRGIEAFSVERWGQATADKYLDDIDAALSRLQQMPALLREEPEIVCGLRFYRVQKHYLVCDVIDDRIYVLTVMHCSMDLPARLSDLEPTLAAEVTLLHTNLQQRDQRGDDRAK